LPRFIGGSKGKQSAGSSKGNRFWLTGFCEPRRQGSQPIAGILQDLPKRAGEFAFFCAPGGQKIPLEF